MFSSVDCRGCFRCGGVRRRPQFLVARVTNNIQRRPRSNFIFLQAQARGIHYSESLVLDAWFHGRFTQKTLCCLFYCLVMEQRHRCRCQLSRWRATLGIVLDSTRATNSGHLFGLMVERSIHRFNLSEAMGA